MTVGENFASSGTYIAGHQQGQWTLSDQQETATGLMKNDERESRWKVTDGMDGETFLSVRYNILIKKWKVGES